MTESTMSGDPGELRARLIEAVGRQGDCVLATVGEDGAPEAAYLSAAITNDAEILVDCHPDARKVANLRHDSRVALVVGGPANWTVQCDGVADEPRGADLVRCESVFGARFPEFAHPTARGLLLVRIRPLWVRVSDFTGLTPYIVEANLP